MGPKTRMLIEALDELADALDKLCQPHWRDWMEESARRLRAGDFAGVTHLLGAYGGMGSFNDVLFASDEFGLSVAALRDRAWALASEIHREVNSG